MEEARFPLWKNIHSVFWKDTSSPRFVTKPTCSVAQHARRCRIAHRILPAIPRREHVCHPRNTRSRLPEAENSAKNGIIR